MNNAELEYCNASNDLWTKALQNLTEIDQQKLNVSNSDKLAILSDLQVLASQAKEECVRKKWKYSRDGRTVLLRELFEKIIQWAKIFTRVGDIIAQSSLQTGIAWAGVRFLLQMAINDIEKYNFVVEGAELISRLIDRYTIFERLYIRKSKNTPASHQLEDALVRLYTAVLLYLSKAKAYLEQNTIARILKSSVIGKDDFQKLHETLQSEQIHVDHCTALVDIERRDELHNETHQILRALLQEIDAPIRRMDERLENIQDHIDKTKRLDILCWLSPLPYNEYHDQAKRNVLDGSGQWLLKDPVYQSWKNDSASSILWLHGIPGSGKSKLVSIVVEEALRAFHNRYSPPPVYFYCRRDSTEPERALSDNIIASIARQLSCLSTGSPLLPPALACYETFGADKSRTKLSIDVSRKLIQELVGYFPVTTIIIDGLDECDSDSRFEILDLFHELISDPESNLVKILISSREDQDIVDQLKDQPSIEITSDRNRSDLERFVKLETAALVTKRRLLRFGSSKAELQKLIVERLTENADGMFLWVTLQLEVLCSLKLDEDIRQRLGRLPLKLAQLYSELHQKLLVTNETRLVTETIMRWLLCAQTTLNSSDFLLAISLDPRRWQNRNRPQTLLTKDQLLDLCCNLVVYESVTDSFRFAHLSVREYLEGQLEYSSPLCHSLAAETTILSLLLFSSHPESSKFLLTTCSIDTDSISSSFPLTKSLHSYAVLFWLSHCEFAKDQRSIGILSHLFPFILFTDSGPSSPLATWLQSRRALPLTSPREWHLICFMVSHPEISLKAFFAACAYDFHEILEHCLSTTKLEDHIMEDSSRRVAITLAAEYRQMRILDKLQEYEDIAITEGLFISLLFYLSGRPSNYILAQVLRRAKRVYITEGFLFRAAAVGDKEIMKALLDRGGASHITPQVLNFTARAGSCEVMEILLDCLGSNVKFTGELIFSSIKRDDPLDLDMLGLLLRRGGVVSDEVLLEVMKHLGKTQGETKEVIENLKKGPVRIEHV